MRRKRLAGGRISVRGSVKSTVSAPVKPEPRRVTIPTPACPARADRRRQPPVRARWGIITALDGAWISRAKNRGEDWNCWGFSNYRSGAPSLPLVGRGTGIAGGWEPRALD